MSAYLRASCRHEFNPYQWTGKAVIHHNLHSTSSDAVLAFSSAQLNRFKLRNGVYITVPANLFMPTKMHLVYHFTQQKMRTPVQPTINIIETEDLVGMTEQAKYHAMQNQVDLRTCVAQAIHS